MFERFTERARQVIVLAQEEARALKHNYIGTEQVLLGLLREEEGLAARALESLGITVERVRAQVVRIVGSSEEVTSGPVPFTPRAKKVLELALREALSLGQNYIGTEHILLGLARENEGVAARILHDFDADSDKIRNRVMGMLADPPPAPLEPTGPSAFALAGPPDPDESSPLETDVELGWRGRPIALAALGAAALARSAFQPALTGGLRPLEMQLLACLALGPPDGPLAEPGELVESLTLALACDHDDLCDAVQALGDQGLILAATEPDDDMRISITAAGATRVDDWLRRTASLFGSWPPDHADVDDAA
jgi:hypothetical protein